MPAPEAGALVCEGDSPEMEVAWSAVEEAEGSAAELERVMLGLAEMEAMERSQTPAKSGGTGGGQFIRFY